MDTYEPDPNKIPVNPFDFKTDPAEAAHQLTRELGVLAEFFANEIRGAGEVEARWWAYQQAKGREAVIRIGSSISNVLGITRELGRIRECNNDHVLDWFGNIIVLLHVGLVELVEGGGHTNSWAWAIKATESEPQFLPESNRPEDVCDYLDRLRTEYEEQQGSARRLARALDKGLDESEKSFLLMAYTFSRPYRVGETTEPWDRMHIHCRERVVSPRQVAGGDINLVPRERAVGECWGYCPRPERDEITRCLPVLAKRYLYRMRNQLVHGASPVMMAATERHLPPGTTSYGLVDAFFLDDDRLVTYRVTHTVTELTSLLRKCVWNRMKDATSEDTTISGALRD